MKNNGYETDDEWFCEYCNKDFTNQNKCVSHERKCCTKVQYTSLKFEDNFRYENGEE